MFPAENLRDWRGEKVIDPDGDKIGDLEAVYVDTTTDEPAFVTVKTGMIGRHRLVFVPVGGATVTPSAVRVRYDKKLISEAPYRSPACWCAQPYFGSRICGTKRIARGDGSMWNSVVRELDPIRCAFSSHSAAFGIGRLFSLIPSSCSSVLPMPP